jgi:hypothetical protein
MLQHQQQNKTESTTTTNSPLSSSTIISAATSTTTTTTTAALITPTTLSDSQQSNSQSSVTYDNISESQLNDTDPIYPALKDCQLSLDKIVHDLTSAMWSSGIIQLLKTKNILTVGDLCLLKAKEFNELPFKTPKIENFLKVIQKFHSNLTTKEIDEPTSTTTTTTPVAVENENKKVEVDISSKSKLSTPMGSLEEEMAKLEEANSLDTSIECESLTVINDKDETKIDSEGEATKKYDELLKEIHESLINQSLDLNVNDLSDKFNSLETTDLLKLMNYINTINFKIAQVNNLVVDKLKSK